MRGSCSAGEQVPGGLGVWFCVGGPEFSTGEAEFHQKLFAFLKFYSSKIVPFWKHIPGHSSVLNLK